MIVKLINLPHVIYQESSEDEMANEAISVYIDNGDTLCLQQRENVIVLNRETVPELCKFLKGYATVPNRGGKP
jgi:hypothetical protein